MFTFGKKRRKKEKNRCVCKAINSLITLFFLTEVLQRHPQILKAVFQETTIATEHDLNRTFNSGCTDSYNFTADKEISFSATVIEVSGNHINIPLIVCTN